MYVVWIRIWNGDMYVVYMDWGMEWGHVCSMDWGHGVLWNGDMYVV